MDKRTEELIKRYLPSPRDESLDDSEYYVKSESGRIYKVYVSEIYSQLFKDTLYGVRLNNGKSLKSSFDYGGFPKGYLYDNKTDCRDNIHNMYNDWETLRLLQEKHNE